MAAGTGTPRLALAATALLVALAAAGGEGHFEAVDGGVNRACRGANASDNRPAFYELFGGLVAQEACRAKCTALPGCKGIEHHESGRCEVWTRADGIGATAAVPGYTCLRYVPAQSPGPVPPAPGSCRGHDPPQQGTDVAGDLLAELSLPTADWCCAACSNSSVCQGFAYLSQWQLCYLKANVTGTYSNPASVARVKSVPPPPAGSCDGYGVSQNDTDVAGALLAELRAPTQGHCCAACSASSACRGFAYLWQEGLCYLKANLTGTFPAPGVTAQLKLGAPPAGGCRGFDPLQSDTDVAGDLLTELHAATAGHCCASCSGTAGCQGFSFVEQWHLCYLKANVTGTYGKSGVVARTKAVPAAPPGSCNAYGDLEHDTDLAGALLAELHMPTMAHCCASCTSTSGCEGFTYVEQAKSCYLKANLTGTYPNAGRQSRIRSSSQGCEGFSQAVPGADLAGALLATGFADSEKGCCGLCRHAEGCQGFVFSEQVCYLKGNLSGLYSNPGHLARCVGSCPPLV